jgi:hypothetical protein
VLHKYTLSLGKKAQKVSEGDATAEVYRELKIRQDGKVILSGCCFIMGLTEERSPIVPDTHAPVGHGRINNLLK